MGNGLVRVSKPAKCISGLEPVFGNSLRCAVGALAFDLRRKMVSIDIRTSGLSAVLRPLEELFFQSVHASRGFFDEGHEAVLATLRPYFLGQSDETIVSYVLDGTVGELSTVWEWSKNEVAALEILNTLRVVDHDASACEEVDDAFLQEVGGDGLLSLLVLFDSVCFGITLADRLFSLISLVLLKPID